MPYFYFYKYLLTVKLSKINSSGPGKFGDENIYNVAK